MCCRVFCMRALESTGCKHVLQSVLQSVLQCVAVCCSVLQCVTVCCSLLQCVAVARSVCTAGKLALCGVSEMFCFHTKSWHTHECVVSHM